MRPSDGATVTESGAVAMSAACVSIERDQIIGSRCTCADTVPLGHQGFGGLRNDRDAMACHTRRPRRSRPGSDIRPVIATEIILDSTLIQEASRVTASPDKTFRDMTAHGTTFTPSRWAYAWPAARSKRRHPGVVAREMASPLEPRRESVTLAVSGR